MKSACACALCIIFVNFDLSTWNLETFYFRAKWKFVLGDFSKFWFRQKIQNYDVFSKNNILQKLPNGLKFWDKVYFGSLKQSTKLQLKQKSGFWDFNFFYIYTACTPWRVVDFVKIKKFSEILLLGPRTPSKIN